MQIAFGITGHAREHVGEPSQWINAVALRRFNQRGRGALTAAIGASEGSVLAPDGDAAHHRHAGVR